MELNEIIGYVFGAAALIAVFFTYQIHEKRKLLMVQTFMIVMMCLHYFFLGATTGFALNVVCILRNIALFFKDKSNLVGAVSPAFFACALVVVSVFAWEGYFSILMMLGLVINTLCVGYLPPQKIRYSLLLTCTIVIVYDVFANSIPGIVFETVGITSAVIGIIRYNKQKSTLLKKDTQ